MAEKRRLELDFEEVQMAMKDQDRFWQLDPHTGQMALHPDESDMDAEFEEGAFAPTDPDDLLDAPAWSSREAYRLMEEFVESEASGAAADALRRALEGRKPFRRFKDRLGDFPVLRERWFEFEADRMRAEAEAFYEDEGIEVAWKPRGG